MQQRAPRRLADVPPGIGEACYALASALYPMMRSITGDGVRETLAVLSRIAPIEIREVASGTRVFDWTVPQEWVIRDAHITGPDGCRVLSLADHTLHVVNYSVPVRARMPLAELKRHIHTLPDQPALIPYRTSYYAPAWGFCMTHAAMEALPDGDYEVLIDAEHRDGTLTYGEVLIPGETTDEVLLSAHICHPSLANDNCSGLALLAHLARHLSEQRTRASYRCLFAPGTIGAIAWLAANEASVGRIKAGLVLSCVGDGGGPTYKRTRRGNALVDRAMAHVLAGDPKARVIDFSPYGYDERQYGSPGFDLPVGLFQRSLHGTFPEYHTSADNLEFIAPGHLARSFEIVARTLDVIEGDARYLNTAPKCEPQLGRRGLYAAMGGQRVAPETTMAALWVLNQSDGAASLLDIAVRSGLPFDVIRDAADALKACGLLVPAPHA